MKLLSATTVAFFLLALNARGAAKDACSAFVEGELKEAALNPDLSNPGVSFASRPDSENPVARRNEITAQLNDRYRTAVAGYVVTKGATFRSGPLPQSIWIPDEAELKTSDGKAILHRFETKDREVKNLPPGAFQALSYLGAEESQPAFDEVLKIGKLSDRPQVMVWLKGGKVRAFLSNLGTMDSPRVKVGLLSTDCKLKAYFFAPLDSRAKSSGLFFQTLNAGACQAKDLDSFSARKCAEYANRFEVSPVSPMPSPRPWPQPFASPVSWPMIYSSPVPLRTIEADEDPVSGVAIPR